MGQKLAFQYNFMQKTILFAEDSRGVAKYIIEELDYVFGNEVKVIHCPDGLSAYDYFINPVHNVDLIISCINMPGMDGITLLKKSKALSPETPFVLFTAVDYRDETGVEQADAYIVKSSDISELIACLKDLLNLLLPVCVN
ncbi:MAG: response regulator [Thermodesulfovibrionales bacterium]